MNKGIFCISIDTELLWGRKDLNYSSFIEKTKKEREIIKKLLKLFKKYNIPTTWAIVGKLNEGKDPLWSGKDIIKLIKSYKNQEIASHSYSHEDFSQISKEKAIKEIKKNKSDSFIFPRNKIKFLEILKKYGFTSYRAKDKSEFELIMPRIPPTGRPRKKKGLIEVPSSMYFVSGRGIKKYIPYGLRLLKSILGINHAVKKKEIFHLWFHPVDFADNTEELLKEFEEILKYAHKQRLKNKLEIKSMREIIL